MKVNVEVVMTPEVYEDAKSIQAVSGNDTLEALVFEWVETDFIDFVNKFEIKIKEAEDNG